MDKTPHSVLPEIDHLFRSEAGKLVSVLTRIFGTQNIDLAEDVVQDTLLKAIQNWKLHGLPRNPGGWLFTVARNKALDVVRRERHHREFAAGISPLLKSEYSAGETIKEIINPDDIEDEQLRMMFVCCHPDIPQEGQIAMILKTLCGFSISEIAKAFLTSNETIEKRLYRARQQFRDQKITFEIPVPEEIAARTSNVLLALYLLFNEGYNSTSHDQIVRDDLIEESLRLGKLLLDHLVTRTPETYALMALFCFQAARVHSRVNDAGDLLPLREQNRSLWNKELIHQGVLFLRRSSHGSGAVPWHMEAAIAYEHCVGESYEKTDWKKIVQLYEWLYILKPHPLIALNRLIAFAEVHGPESALNESQSLADASVLKNYHLYPAALGEWCAQVKDKVRAKEYFIEAIALTNSSSAKRLLERKIAQLKI